MIEVIESKNISVIVQGLVVGATDVDGEKRFTERCLNSVRKYLPDAQIIFSTWERCNTDNLNCDVLIKGVEPEDIFMSFSDGTLKLMTVNNQIISTQNGLKASDRPYALKIRSDILLNGTSFIKYFEKYNKNNDSQFLKKRVVTLPTYNPRKGAKFLFDPSDWIFFGLTEDIKNIFNIPIMKEDDLKGEKKNGHFLIKNNLEAEQYIWVNFLSKYKKINLPSINFFSEELLEESEASYARNLIMMPAQKIKVKCLKMPNAGYGARPWLSQGLYTYSDYRRMYNKYNDKKIPFIPNIAEDICYFLAYKSRLLIKNTAPGAYRRIVNFVRKINGSYNFLK